MSSQGPLSPGTVADDSSVGSLTWLTLNNEKVEDGADTTATNNSATTTATSHYLKGTNFGFSLPVTAVIDGILVEYKKNISGGGASVKDSSVRIVKSDGSIGTTNKADTVTAWTTTRTFYSYGSSSDIWGETWTPSDINSANFGTVMSADVTMGPTFSASARVDYARITVYYTDWAANVSDSTAVSDTPNLVVKSFITVTESSAVSESLALVELTQYNLSVNDVSAVSDSTSQVEFDFLRLISVSDAVAVADTNLQTVTGWQNLGRDSSSWSNVSLDTSSWSNVALDTGSWANQTKS